MMDKIFRYEPLWGDWLIDEKLGEGSYGKVYRIRREIKGSTFYAAVKIITIPQSTSEISALSYEGMSNDSISLYFQQVLDGLVEEIELLYSFRGLSNIVNIDDYKVIKNDDNITYDILIKMELLKDLSSYVQSSPLSKSEVLKLAIDMCKALEACHKKNIIHRDIKPDNIFISDHGDYKLGDFGVARKMEKTLSGLSKKGTYLYMAPEVYKGEDYDHTVDIYSLGIVIYRYLNGGKLPFFSSNQVMYKQREEALARRLRGEPLPYPESGQRDFESIILKACIYNSKERYQNIKEFKDALDKVKLDSMESVLITTLSLSNTDIIKTDSIESASSLLSSRTDIAIEVNNETNKEISLKDVQYNDYEKTVAIQSTNGYDEMDFYKTAIIGSDSVTMEDIDNPESGLKSSSTKLEATDNENTETLDKAILSNLESTLTTTESLKKDDKNIIDSIQTESNQFDIPLDTTPELETEKKQDQDNLDIHVLDNDPNIAFHTNIENDQIDFEKTSLILTDSPSTFSFENLEVGYNGKTTSLDQNNTENIGNVKNIRLKSSVTMSRKARPFLLFVGVFIALVGVTAVLSQTIFKNDVLYYMAKNHFENARYETASEMFNNLGVFKDSSDLKNESDYLLAETYLLDSDFDKAFNIFQSLSSLNYKDSSERFMESKYQSALDSYEKDNGSGYSKLIFKEIESYKDSNIYIAMIDDLNYRKFYEDCETKNGTVGYGFNSPFVNQYNQEIVADYTVCSYDDTVTALENSPLESYKTFVENGMNYSKETRYLFARLLGTWESSNKKIKINIYLYIYKDWSGTFGHLEIMLTGLKFEYDSYDEFGDKSIGTYQTSRFHVQGSMIMNNYDGGSKFDKFASVEFIDDNSIRLTTIKDGKAYILYRKQDN